MSNIYPPAPNTISDPNVTANRFANSTQLIARRLRELSDFRYIGGLLLPNRVQTTSGAINYEVTSEAITADDVPQQVAPGAEYQLTQSGDGTAQTAATAKYGEDGVLTDESLARLQAFATEKKLRKIVNSTKILIDTTVVAAVNGSISTNSVAATQKWDGSGTTPFIFRDIMKAKAAITATNLGYQPDLLLVSDEVVPYLMDDSKILAAMAREDRTNPIYTGKFPAIGGLEVMSVPAANLPGGATTAAFVLDRNQLGFILTENLGGNYQAAGDLVEVKSWRTEEVDGVRFRARSVFKAIVTDPLAAYRITTVL